MFQKSARSAFRPRILSREYPGETATPVKGLKTSYDRAESRSITIEISASLRRWMMVDLRRLPARSVLSLKLPRKPAEARPKAGPA